MAINDNHGPLSQEDIDALIAAVTETVQPSVEVSPLDPPRVTESTVSPTETPLLASPRTIEAPASPPQDPRLARLGDLPLRLAANLGKGVLSVQQVLNIGIGTRITLDGQWLDSIALTLNGLAVGSGRVVLVGNRFGVEVVRWGPQHSDPAPGSETRS